MALFGPRIPKGLQCAPLFENLNHDALEVIAARGIEWAIRQLHLNNTVTAIAHATG